MHESSKQQASAADCLPSLRERHHEFGARVTAGYFTGIHPDRGGSRLRAGDGPRPVLRIRGYGFPGYGYGYASPFGYGMPGYGYGILNPFFGLGLTPLGIHSYFTESNLLGRGQLEASRRARARELQGYRGR
ncbi:MAG: hypothetical protein ACXWOV_16045 [Isosphaeraceae bacterium]